MKTAEVIATRSKGADQSPHLVVWRVYWVDGRFVAGDVQAKVAGALARLKGRGDEGAALIVHADAGSVAASGAALQAFMQDNLAALGARLQQTRDAR
jgi:EpsI family protein